MALAVSRHGKGQRLVCIHGWGLSARVWGPIVDEWAGSLAVQTVDLPGHGDSPAGAAGLQNWTEALLASIDGPAVLMGWSLGGLVALDAARCCPEAVRGLVLVATLPRLLRSEDWPWGMHADAVTATGRGLERDFEATLQGFLNQQVLSEPGAAALLRQLQPSLFAQQPDPAGLAAGLDILREADLRADLASMTCPTLAIAGERDRIAHPDGMAWMAEQMPQAEFWRVPGAAHAPFWSHAPEFAQRVAAHVAGV